MSKLVLMFVFDIDSRIFIKCINDFLLESVKINYLYLLLKG